MKLNGAELRVNYEKQQFFVNSLKVSSEKELKKKAKHATVITKIPQRLRKAEGFMRVIVSDHRLNKV